MDARCFVAMRYWNPSTADAIRQVQAHRFDQLVLLPLYPQYSKTTTGSSLNEWRRRYGTVTNRSQVRMISAFHMHPLYIDAVVEKINLGLERFLEQTPLEGLPARPVPLGGEGLCRERTGDVDFPNVTGPKPFRLAPGQPSAGDVRLIFSAHGVPLKEIERGDPYQAQIESTTRSVMERGQWPNPHCLCYQSRVGPGKWLAPSLEATLRRLAAEGAQQALVIPISFVTDHVETLHEIGIEARQLAQNLGFRQFEVMPALNDSPTFLRALADLVSKAAGVARQVELASS
jgi:ferrochelatase